MSEQIDIPIDETLQEELVDNQEVYENWLKIDDITSSQPRFSIDATHTDLTLPPEIANAMSKAMKGASKMTIESNPNLDVIPEASEETTPVTTDNGGKIEKDQLQTQDPGQLEVSQEIQQISNSPSEENTSKEANSLETQTSNTPEQISNTPKNQYSPMNYEDLLKGNNSQVSTSGESRNVPNPVLKIDSNIPILDKIFQLVTKIDEKNYSTRKKIYEMDVKFRESIETISLCISDLSNDIETIKQQTVVPAGLVDDIGKTQSMLTNIIDKQELVQKETLEEVKLCKNQLSDLKIILGSIESNMQQRDMAQNYISVATPTIAGARYMESEPTISAPPRVVPLAQPSSSTAAPVTTSSPNDIYNESKIISRFGRPVSHYTGCEAFHKWIESEGKKNIKDFFPTMDAVDMLAAKRAIGRSKDYAAQIFGFKKG